MNLPKSSPWNRYRRWRLALWISAPTFFAVGKLASPLPHELGVLVASIPAFVSLFALQFFKCPRCGKYFFYDGVWRAWTKDCVNCGLPKWKEADYVNPDSDEQIAFRSLSIAEMAATAAISAPECNSKFLLLVLRDDPGAIHLTLDSEGWADVNNLLTRANRYGFKLTREDLAEVIAASESHRFEWDKAGNRIRAVRN